MTDTTPDRSPHLLQTALGWLLSAVAVAYVLLFLGIALFRIWHPFELEWMEGAMVDHVLRIRDGKILYGPPSLSFTPFIYPPLYYYLAVGASAVLGEGFLALRVISLLSICGCFFLIYRLVRRETGRHWAGVLAAGMFAATFAVSGAWFDVGRLDSTFLFFSLASAYGVRFSTTTRAAVIAGIWGASAFLTKQPALMIVAPLALFLLLTDRRLGLWYAIAAGIVGGWVTVWLNIRSGGWYGYYVFELMFRHDVVTSNYLDFWTRDVFAALPVAVAFTILFFPVAALNDTDRKPLLFYAALLVGCLAASYSSRLHSGGANNVLFPVYAALSILTGVGAAAVVDLMRDWESQRRTAGVLAGSAALFAQFAMLVYNPIALVPAWGDAAVGHGLIRVIAEIPGPVYMPCHGYLPRMAGKETHAHAIALADVLRGNKDDAWFALDAEIREAAAEKRFAALILDSGLNADPRFRGDYRPVRRIFPNKNAFWTVTGLRTRPDMLFLPK